MNYAEQVAQFKARATQRIADISASLNGGGPGGGERAIQLATYLSDFLITLGDDVLPPDQALYLIHLLNDQAAYLSPASALSAPELRITAPISGAEFAPGQVITVRAVATDRDGVVAGVEFFNGAYELRITLPSAVGNMVLLAKATDNDGQATNAQVFVLLRVSLSVPGMPTECVATLQPTGLRVTARPPANNGGAVITGYVIYRDGDLAHPLATGVALPYDDLTAQAGTSYTYQVAATNSVGTGQPSLPSQPLGQLAEGLLFLDAQGDDALLFLDAIAS
jgi:hypothetical protein